MRGSLGIKENSTKEKVTTFVAFFLFVLRLHRKERVGFFVGSTPTVSAVQ